jgi:hypothetical protein
MAPGVSMKPHRDVCALERILVLWKESATTPVKSERYKALTQEIRAEAIAYMAGVDTAIADDQRQSAARPARVAEATRAAMPGPASPVASGPCRRQRRIALSGLSANPRQFLP